MHLAYRWFTRLDFDKDSPDHSTFSKNRHERLRQPGVFRLGVRGDRATVCGGWFSRGAKSGGGWNHAGSEHAGRVRTFALGKHLFNEVIARFDRSKA